MILDSNPRSTYRTPLTTLYIFIKNLNNRPSNLIAYPYQIENLSNALCRCDGLIVLLKSSSNDEGIAQRARVCTNDLKRISMPERTASNNPHIQDPRRERLKKLSSSLLTSRGNSTQRINMLSIVSTKLQPTHHISKHYCIK